jgi:hypothetical protein
MAMGSVDAIAARRCFNVDWDGVIQKEAGFWGNFNKTLNIIPSKWDIAKALWHIKGTLAKGLLNAIQYREISFYDDQGNILRGNNAHLVYFGTKSPIVAQYHERILDVLAEGEPMDATIDFLLNEQDQGALLVAWTNNDEISYKKKLAYVNKQRTLQGKRPINLDGYFVIGTGINDYESDKGKPHDNFYTKALKYSEKVAQLRNINPNTLEHYFIDDKQKNLDGLHNASLPIKVTAILRPKDDLVFKQNYVTACNQSTGEDAAYKST